MHSKYADDLQLAVFGKPRDRTVGRWLVLRSLEENLSALSLWCGKNGIQINANKAQLIVIGTGPNLRKMPHIQVQFMDTTIFGFRSVNS